MKKLLKAMFVEKPHWRFTDTDLINETLIRFLCIALHEMCLYKKNYIVNQRRFYAAALFLMFSVSYFFKCIWIMFKERNRPGNHLGIDYLSKHPLCLDHCFLAVTLAALLSYITTCNSHIYRKYK